MRGLPASLEGTHILVDRIGHRNRFLVWIRPIESTSEKRSGILSIKTRLWKCPLLVLPTTCVSAVSHFDAPDRFGVHQVSLFDNGGRVTITEFSWNPPDMFGREEDQMYGRPEDGKFTMSTIDAKNASCQAAYEVDICFPQRQWPGVDPYYWIPM